MKTNTPLNIETQVRIQQLTLGVDYRHYHKPAIAMDVKPELIETVAKSEDAPAAVGQSDLNLVVEVPPFGETGSHATIGLGD